MMRNLVATLLATLLLAGALMGVIGNARAEDTSRDISGSLERSTYPLVTQGLVSSDTYIPGDTIKFTLTGIGTPDGIQDVYDVAVFTSASRLWAQRVPTLFLDNVGLVNGKAVVTWDGSNTRYLSDQTYYIGVFASNYDTVQSGPNRLISGDMSFRIQLYYFDIQASRRGFIPGETIQVFWSALNLKDSTPANGHQGAWVFTTFTGGTCSPATITSGAFSAGTGSINVTFANLANPSCIHSLQLWYNGTTDGGMRAGFDSYSTFASPFSSTFWFLGRLRGSSSYTSSPSSVPGAVASLTIRAYVQDSAGNQYPIPDSDVRLNFSRVDGTQRTTVTGGGNFRTDGAGIVSYAFILSDPYNAGFTYIATSNISKILEMAIPAPTSTFTVGQAGTAITTTLLLDKGSYYGGDTVSISALAVAAPGADATFTYTYDVYLCTSSATSSSLCPQSGSAIYEVDHIRSVTSNPTYSYAIRQGFSGYIKVVVAVSNQQGHYGTATQYVRILGADLVVNADPNLFRSGDRITVSYSTTLITPTFMYVVHYSVGGTSVIQTQGSTTSNSFYWDVPQQGPPSTYTATVYASSSGRVVAQSVTVSLQSGVALEISTDRGSYAPGDTIGLGYKLSPVGNGRLPESVLLTVFVGSVAMSFRSLNTEDTVRVALPATLNSGDQFMSVVAADGATGSTIATANEVIAIRGLGNPLWFVRLADMPIVEWVLLGLVAVLLLFGFKSGMIPLPRRGAGGKPPKKKEAPTSEKGRWGPPPP